MKVFVTGGTGYLGAYIVAELVARGHEVTVLTRSRGRNSNSKTRLVEGDLLDCGTYRWAVKGHDACVHNAICWESDGPESGLQDARASASLFDLALHTSIRNLVYTSSTAVHRPFKELMSEEDRLTPFDSYAAAKLQSEALLSELARRSAIRCNVVRCGPIIGPPLSRGVPINCDHRFASIVKAAMEGREITVARLDGRQFLAGSDAGRVFAEVLQGSGNGGTYLATSRNYTTWQQVADQVVSISGSSSRLVVAEPPVNRCLFDVSRIKGAFGLTFDSRGAMRRHLAYLIGKAQ